MHQAMSAFIIAEFYGQLHNPSGIIHPLTDFINSPLLEYRGQPQGALL